MVKKLINNLVICAPNINEGGPLTILNEAINSAKKKFPNTNIINKTIDSAIISSI